MKDKHVLVIFRRWRDSGDSIALLPALPSDINGWYCFSYEQISQHASADHFRCIQATRPATDEEAAPYYAEELSRIKRASRRTHEACRAAARAIRACRL